MLTEPYLSVIRISNEGNKPILSKDFEAPLEMQMEKPQSAVQAIVSEKSPKDIQAILDWDSQAIRLKPTLLNPQDSITIEVLSQGGLPTFAFSSRIAGIGAVTVRNASDKKEKPFFLIISFLLAYLLAIPAVAGIWRLATLAVAGLWLTQINAVSITLRGRTIAALIMIGVASVEFVMLRIFDMLKIDSLIYLTISMILLFLAAIPFALMLERPSAVVADK